MKAKKIAALFVAAAMTVSMIGCGNNDATTTTSTETTETTVETSTETETEAPAETETETEVEATVEEAAHEASIDFADGSVSFIGVDKSVNSAAGEFTFDAADGALKVVPQGGKPYVGIQMDALLGDKIGDVASVEMHIGVENQGDNFYSASGNIYAMALDGVDKAASAWSVYLETANPKSVTMQLPAAAVEGSYLVVSMESDTAADYKGQGQSTLVIQDITFCDAAGNVLAADTSAEYVAASTGADRTNLFGISGAIDLGLSGSGDGWNQIGYVDIPEDAFEVLATPGSVVEIAYASETGNMWMGLSGNAWTRLGVGDCDGSGQGYAYYNNTKTIAQIPYEEIAKVVGEDASNWDKQIFLESDGAFEVYSVKIGMQAPSLVLTDAIDIGLSGSTDGWSQIGYVDIPEDAYALLQTPGSMVEITYASENGDLWMGLSGNAWTRIGVGAADGSNGVDAITDGSKCYVTYDMITSLCGDDPSTWDKQIFIESDTKFEVFSVKIGKAGCFTPNNKRVDANLSGAGGGWSQLGDGLSEEAVAALTTPGSVVNISYSSATGECWIVMPDSAAGWMRVGVGDFDGSGQEYAVYDGSFCQITYDQIAAVCGDDASTWGARIQVEATSDFEVYAVTIGQTE